MSVGSGVRVLKGRGGSLLTPPHNTARTVEANEDYEDYEEYGELPAGDDPDAHWQPVTPLQLFEGRRNRRRREAPKVVEEQESKVQYTVCIWWVPAPAPAGEGGGWEGPGQRLAWEQASG